MPIKTIKSLDERKRKNIIMVRLVEQQFFKIEKEKKIIRDQMNEDIIWRE
jgi:hypothetical protein